MTITVRRDIPFHEVDGETLQADIYESAAGSEPKSVAILVRGGGFTVGDKGEFARYALDLAEAGYRVVEPQYRLAPDWTFPAPLIDVKAAIEWCRTGEEFATPQDVVAVGHSAGANLVALAAATADDPAFEPTQYPGTSSALSAVVGYAGIYEFRRVADDDRHHERYLGGTADEIPEAYDLASPVAQVDVSMPPTLLCHSHHDSVVPSDQSDLLAEALDPLTTVEQERVDAGHGFPFDGAYYDDVFERTAEFLQQHLGTPDTRPDGVRDGQPEGDVGRGEPPVGDPTDDVGFGPR